MWRLTLIFFVFLVGCTIPAEVLFRNFSNKTIRLQATLLGRHKFDKLPNRVGFYDTARKSRAFYGDWRSAALVTWVDSTSFYIDVPAFTVIDVTEISRRLVLGARQPDVLLMMITDEKVDTLTTGDYISVTEKFKSTGYGVFRNPVYYYDVH